jgi:hypothetical protein
MSHKRLANPGNNNEEIIIEVRREESLQRRLQHDFPPGQQIKADLISHVKQISTLDRFMAVAYSIVHELAGEKVS